MPDPDLAELDAAVKSLAAQLEKQSTGGGHLIREDLGGTLRKQFAWQPLWGSFRRESHERWLAEEAALSRGYKFGRSIRRAFFDWRGRLRLAWDVLRDRHECERD